MRDAGAAVPVRRGIQARLAVLVLVAALGPMILLGWSSLSSLAVTREALLRERRALVASATRQVDHGVRGMFEALAAVPATVAGSPRTRATQHDALRAAELRSRLLSGAMLVDVSGEILAEGAGHDPEARRQLAGTSEVREAIRAGKPAVCPLAGAAGRRRFVVVPLRGAAGTTDAAAVGVVNLDDPAWTSLVAPMPIDRSARLTLRDERGGLVAGSPGAAAAGKDVEISERLTVVPWTLALTQPEKEMFAAVEVLERRWMVLAPALAAVAGLFAWGVARSVKLPLARLGEAAARIADGDLTQPLPALGEDEVGRLGRSFEAMRVALARDETRRLLLRKVITAQEEERKRIARELHDETCQTIAALKMKLDAAGMEEAQAMAARSLDELHRIIYDLRPSMLDDLGLLPAIRWMAQRNLAASGARLRLEFEEPLARLPSEVEISLFRAVQEAVSNIVRHAHAESVLIQVAVNEGVLDLDIEDDGCGFTVSDAAGPIGSARGLGILGMRERTELIGGRAEVVSAPGKGTHVSLFLPMPEGAAHA